MTTEPEPAGVITATDDWAIMKWVAVYTKELTLILTNVLVYCHFKEIFLRIEWNLVVISCWTLKWIIHMCV